MSNETTGRARITARVTGYAEGLIERAAAITGTTINQFVAQAAYAEAERVLSERSAIQLSARDAERFFAALDNPPPVNPRLAEALRRHVAKHGVDRDNAKGD